MKKQVFQKRVLICSFVALASGLFGAYAGGQINIISHQQQCDAKTRQLLSVPGLNYICKAWVTPGAIWQGSTTGLWVGTIVGAFIAGLATRKADEETTVDNISSLSDQEKEF